MSYKNYKWTVIANDFNAPFIKNYLFTKAFFKYAKLLEVSRVNLGTVSRSGELEIITDLDTWTKTHQDLKDITEKDIHFVERVIDKTNSFGEKFNDWSEEQIFSADLSNLDNNELVNLLNEFIGKQETMYAYGAVLPLIDFRGFAFVEGNLKKFLEKKVGPEKFSKYYEVLTSPIRNSFAQDQEEDLLRLMEQFYGDLEGIKNKSLDEIKVSYPKLYKKLQEHTKKHCWVYYVYIGPAFTEQNFLDFIKDYLEKGINPSNKLNELKEKRENIEKLRKQYIEELNQDEFNGMILTLAGKLMWAKPRRKDLQSKSYYHLEKLMKEFAKRLSISVNQARSATPEMLEKFLKQGKADTELLNSIYKLHICLPNDDGTISVLHGKEAKAFYDTHVEKEEINIKDIGEIKGTTTSPGKAKGVVKIINKPSDMNKMEQGDILVSIATAPSIVPAMKKAAAIVTDEGGLTCHASIVSRELGITCVIGTKFASKILKDGDKVEVDADKGLIRRI